MRELANCDSLTESQSSTIDYLNHQVAASDSSKMIYKGLLLNQTQQTDVAVQSLSIQRKEATKKTLGLIVISVAAGIIVGHL